ncbi:MAG: guanylate kinase, partial [Beijerinckiaceae bacterium]
APVEQAIAEGRDLLFDIDYKGTLQLYEKMRPNIVSIFILPPSAAALKARLERRAEDSAQVINRRLKTALTELNHWHCFDHIVVNDDLDATFQTLRGILAAGRSATSRNGQLGALAESMERDLASMVLPDDGA